MDEMTVEYWQDPEAPGRQGLKLSGRLTIGQAAGLRTTLLDALGAAMELQVDVSGIEEVDLAGLQLLCATHQSAQAAGKPFSLSDGGNMAYRDSLVRAGFRGHIGCAAGQCRSCIWAGGEIAAGEKVGV